MRVRSHYVEALLQLGRERADSVAVTDLRETRTFGELVAEAAGVAAWLNESSSGRGPVVVLVSRHPSSVAGILGVLWAGRTVVPLDANEPVDRLAELTRRVAATDVLDPSGTAVPTIGGLPVQRMPAAATNPARWPDLAEMRADELALIMFTSGSTGRPKGVVRTASRLNEYLAACRRLPGLMDDCRMATFGPLHFLAGFNSGMNGVIAGRFTALIDVTTWSLPDLFVRLSEHQVDRFYLTPSLLRSFAAAGINRTSLPTLREVWCSGEALHWSDVEVMRTTLGDHLTLTGMYASSEGNGPVAQYVVPPGTPCGEGRLPIGRAMNRSGLSLDFAGRSDEERAAGIGELVFRGEVADGYLDDDELNERRFRADPDGVRTWHSGDLASFDADGIGHLHGRVDDMVKINGRTVEPAEAEQALRSIDGVHHAVVLPRQLASGRYQLVAHLVADRSVSIPAVRAELRKVLPLHLVPALFLRHNQLPLNDRGKVDHAALRSLMMRSSASLQPSSDAEFDPVLGLVLATSRRLLDWDDLGPDDNLWDMGLDSLGAIELLHELVGTRPGLLDPASLMRVLTCRDLASELQRAERSRRSNVVALHTEAPGQPMVILGGGGGSALQYRALLSELGDQSPLLFVEQRGLHRWGGRDRTIPAAAQRALGEVRSFQPTGPYVLVGHSWGGLVAHEMARRLLEGGETVSLVLLDPARNTPKPQPPLHILEHRDAWPVWAAKYLLWRLYRLRRYRAFMARVGSVQRYDGFFVKARRMARRYHADVLDVPVTLVHPEGSGNADGWDDHPGLVKVIVGGDHVTMVQHPHVVDVAAALHARCLGTPSTGERYDRNGTGT